LIRIFIIFFLFIFYLETPAFASGGYPSISTMERYIQQRAHLYSVDSRIALRVAHSEGLNAAGESVGYKVHDPVAYSYGPFQLHDGGLVTQFGHHPTGSNWKQQIDFSLNYAAHNGWSSWFGAARVGVGRQCGIRGHLCGRVGPWHVKRTFHWRHGPSRHWGAGHWHKHRTWTAPHRHRWHWRVHSRPHWRHRR
jgi:hypothetical protein